MNKEDLNLEEYYRLETDSKTSNFKDSSGEEIFRERIFKTAVQTGLGTAIPQLGNAKEVTADAIGTALIWAEGSALISCADVVVTNTRNSTKKQTTTRSSRRYGVSILDRELLLT